MGGIRFGARTIVDGHVVIAFDHHVVVTVFRIPEWTMELAERLYAESIPLTQSNAHTLVRMIGSEPTAAVRKRLADLQADLDAKMRMDEERRVAVVTDSALTRGALTAMRWLTGDEIKGFATTDAFEAANWVAGPNGNGVGVMELYQQCVDYHLTNDRH